MHELQNAIFLANDNGCHYGVAAKPIGIKPHMEAGGRILFVVVYALMTKLAAH